MSKPKPPTTRDTNQEPLIPGLSEENGGTSRRESERDSNLNRMGTGSFPGSHHSSHPNQSPSGSFTSSGHSSYGNQSPSGSFTRSDHSSHPNQSPSGSFTRSDQSSNPNQSPSGSFTRSDHHSSYGNQSPSGSFTGSDHSSYANCGESSSYKGASSYQAPESEPKWEMCDIKKMKKEPQCHMPLDVLLASHNHTVLVDTQQLRHGRIVPHQTQPVWHHNFVRLPPEYPSSFFDSRWGTTKKALQHLTKGHATVRDIETAIKSYNERHKKLWNFTALQTYSTVIPISERERIPGVIAKMAELALKLPELIKHPIPLLKRGMNHSITMSQEQIACLLAHAFFCTFPHRNTNKPGSEYANFPTINFSSLLSDEGKRKTEKLRALFHYFSAVTNSGRKPDGLVTFERIYVPASELPEWQRSKDRLTNLYVSEKGSIEREGKGMLQVDFACKLIGGGVLGRGLVQEEIRFLQCPELIVSRLFTEKLEDNECLKITGVQQYNSTSGYSDGFVWDGPYTDDTERDEWKRRYCQIVAIDALNFKFPEDQYSPGNIKRELNKAYVGFRRDQQIHIEYVSAIATGNWGCGAFKGDHRLKALIQMMAAAAAHRDLAYFTFGNKQQAEELQAMYSVMKARKITVGDLYRLLNDYCTYYRSYRRDPKLKNVFEFVQPQLPNSQL